jgi:hypothetical protein
MKKITKREERPERTDPAVVEAVAAALDDEAEADLDPVELADAEAEKEEEEQDSEEAEMLKDWDWARMEFVAVEFWTKSAHEKDRNKESGGLAGGIEGDYETERRREGKGKGDNALITKPEPVGRGSELRGCPQSVAWPGPRVHEGRRERKQGTNQLPETVKES